MTTTVQTMFGNLNEAQLKSLKGGIDEMVVVMHKQNELKADLKAIIDSQHEKNGVPKKLLRKMAKVQFKQSFNEEVEEQKDFESVFETLSKIS